MHGLGCYDVHEMGIARSAYAAFESQRRAGLRKVCVCKYSGCLYIMHT